jgi:hypothetical protein
MCRFSAIDEHDSMRESFVSPPLLLGLTAPPTGLLKRATGEEI